MSRREIGYIDPASQSIVTGKDKDGKGTMWQSLPIDNPQDIIENVWYSAGNVRPMRLSGTTVVFGVFVGEKRSPDPMEFCTQDQARQHMVSYGYLYNQSPLNP